MAWRGVACYDMGYGWYWGMMDIAWIDTTARRLGVRL